MSIGSCVSWLLAKRTSGEARVRAPAWIECEWAYFTNGVAHKTLYLHSFLLENLGKTVENPYGLGKRVIHAPVEVEAN